MTQILHIAFFFLTGFFACSIFSLIIGFMISKKNEKKNTLLNLLNDLKTTIEAYKCQSEINSNEVKTAMENASKLTKILTTNQNLKGKFGEDCLEMVLRAVYPNENINYIKQFDSINEEDKKVKPDYVINLPNNKNILIDCKLNLEKYIEYKEAKNEDIELKKNEFIKDLNATINNLANKKYETIDLVQPDFIIMYIPLEPVITAIYTDPDLICVVKNANEKNIIIAGTSSILTVLRLTKLIWAQDRQDKNLDKIIQTGQSIYNLVAQHSQNLNKIKLSMEENLNCFNKEYEKLQLDNKLFKTAQALQEYGIEASKKRTGKKFDEIKIHDDFLI